MYKQDRRSIMASVFPVVQPRAIVRLVDTFIEGLSAQVGPFPSTSITVKGWSAEGWTAGLEPRCCTARDDDANDPPNVSMYKAGPSAVHLVFRLVCWKKAAICEL